MHFEILVEDASGKKMLNNLVPKIIGTGDTFKVISYKGIGHVPKNLASKAHPVHEKLLNDLPRMLRAYGSSWKGYAGVVVVVCDLDRNNKRAFISDLTAIIKACPSAPKTKICLSIEEGEAWLLGDIPAILAAYPFAKRGVLRAYVNDSICGTWEVLADAVYQGGAPKLSSQGYQASGKEKSVWAERISAHMNTDQNASPSFCAFRDFLKSLRS